LISTETTTSGLRHLLLKHCELYRVKENTVADTDTIDEDFFAVDAESTSASESFKHKVTAMVHEVKDLERRETKLMDEIKELARRRTELETKLIPDALMEAGVRELTTLEGLKVSTKFFVGAIPANKKDEAYAWLEAHGAASIIKRNVSLKLDKGSDAMAEKAADALRQLGLDPKVSLEIHAQTFMSYAREQINKGNVLPLTDWGVFHGEKAVIKE
jgi:hypothetical protein